LTDKDAPWVVYIELSCLRQLIFTGSTRDRYWATVQGRMTLLSVIDLHHPEASTRNVTLAHLKNWGSNPSDPGSSGQSFSSATFELENSSQFVILIPTCVLPRTHAPRLREAFDVELHRWHTQLVFQRCRAYSSWAIRIQVHDAVSSQRGVTKWHQFKIPLSPSVFAALDLKPVTSPGDLLSPELSMYHKKQFAMFIVLNPP
jgi:hypothetical protein